MSEAHRLARVRWLRPSQDATEVRGIQVEVREAHILDHLKSIDFGSSLQLLESRQIKGASEGKIKGSPHVAPRKLLWWHLSICLPCKMTDSASFSVQSTLPKLIRS